MFYLPILPGALNQSCIAFVWPSMTDASAKGQLGSRGRISLMASFPGGAK